MAILTKVLRDPEMAAIRAVSCLDDRMTRRRRGAHPATSVVPVAPHGSVQRTSRAFDRHGSDKTSAHSYAEMYAGLLASLPHAAQVLEVGLGSNHTDVPCSMGENGRPGASLRAMREIRPDITVVGADIDRRVLFSEPGIDTRWVDQLDPASLVHLATSVGGPSSCDLVIDDGLHTKRSNLNTFRALFPTVKPGGSYVVEDIDGSAIPMWTYLLKRRGLAHQVLDFRPVSGYGIDVAVVVRGSAV